MHKYTPVDPENISEYLVHCGMNRVFNDTARHRWEVRTSADLPTGKALPYTPGDAEYRQLLDPSRQRKALPAPGGVNGEPPKTRSADPFFEDAAKYRALAESQRMFVLPGPLINAIIFSSKVNVGTLWRPSPLRENWANYRIDRAKKLRKKKNYQGFATELAYVFGAMLPGFGAGSEAETTILQNVWERLSDVIDQKSFLEQLRDALRRASSQKKPYEVNASIEDELRYSSAPACRATKAWPSP